MFKKYLYILPLLLTSCSIIRFFSSYEEKAKTLYMNAQTQQTNGNTEAALTLYTELLKKYPESKIAPYAWYEAGEIFYKRQDFKHAKGAFSTLITRYPRFEKNNDVYKKLIPLYLNDGETDKAFVYLLKALKNYSFPYLKTYVKHAFKQGINPSFLEKYLHDILKLDIDWLEEMFYYYVASGYLKKHNAEKALHYFEELKRLFPRSILTITLLRKIQEFKPKVQKLTIGLLLENDKTYSMLSSQLKKGLKLSLSSNINNFTIINASMEEPIEKSVEKFISNGATVVVGPLTSKHLKSILPYIKNSKLTLISPTAKEPFENEYPCLFQLNDYSIKETEKLAHYILSIGIKKIGIIHEQNENTKIVERFKNIILSHGGSIIEETFSPGETNFRSLLASIRYKGIGALFLPVDKNNLLTIATQINFYRMRLPVLALSNIIDEDIFSIESSMLDNTIIASVSGNFIDKSQFNEFITKYKKQYKKYPEWAATLGFDCGMFIYKALLLDKNNLCKGLKLIEQRKGFVGQLTFNDNDNGSVKIYKIYKGNVKEVR